MKRISFLLIFFLISIFLYSEEEKEVQEFVVSFYDTTIHFNPIHTFTATEAQVYNAVYEGLVSYHPLTMEPVPAVASRWEISPDGRTYRFFLRPDARYWNGERVLASHFREAWLKILDPEEEAAYSFLFDVIKGAEEYRNGINTDPQSVAIRAVSDNMLEVELESAAGHFLKILCHHSFVPIHPMQLKAEDWSEFPSIISNGPYYIVERSDEEILFFRNELYWDRRNVDIPRLRMIFTDDVEKVIRDFNAGEIDWIADNVPFGEINPKDAVIINPLFATSYYYIGNVEEEWENPQIRRALALLLPWEEIRSPQYNYLPASTLVPSIPYYPEVEGITETDSEEALRLLSDEGYGNGEGLPEIIIQIPDGMESRRIAGLMKDAWESAIEIEVSIKAIPGAEYYDSLTTLDYTLGTVTWIGDFADPLTFLQMWTSGSNLNDAEFSDDTYDQLLRRSMSESGTERYETLAEAETYLLQNAEVLPIGHSPAINIVDLEYVTGWYPNPLDIHPFKYLSYAELEPLPGLVMKID